MKERILKILIAILCTLVLTGCLTRGEAIKIVLEKYPDAVVYSPPSQDEVSNEDVGHHDIYILTKKWPAALGKTTLLHISISQSSHFSETPPGERGGAFHDAQKELYTLQREYKKLEEQNKQCEQVVLDLASSCGVQHE